MGYCEMPRKRFQTGAFEGGDRRPDEWSEKRVEGRLSSISAWTRQGPRNTGLAIVRDLSKLIPLQSKHLLCQTFSGPDQCLPQAADVVGQLRKKDGEWWVSYGQSMCYAARAAESRKTLG